MAERALSPIINLSDMFDINNIDFLNMQFVKNSLNDHICVILTSKAENLQLK